MAILSSFIKVNKYKRFSFTPRYYDERKERREEFIKQLEEEDKRKSGEAVQYKSVIKRGLFDEARKKYRKENKTSFLRVLVILAALLIIVYLLLR